MNIKVYFAIETGIQNLLGNDINPTESMVLPILLNLPITIYTWS